jgi:hypothetical protein
MIWYRKNGHFLKGGLLTIQEVFNNQERKEEEISLITSRFFTTIQGAIPISEMLAPNSMKNYGNLRKQLRKSVRFYLTISLM